MMISAPLFCQGKNLLKFPNLIHGFSSRALGNMSFKRGKTKEVVSNRRKFLGQLGVGLEQVVVMKLEHTNKTLYVNELDLGKGAFKEKNWIEDIDGLITNVPGVFLFTTFADCLPIFIFDPKRNLIALLHAGWRGTVIGICTKTIERLKLEFSSNPRDLQIFIGPSIHSCCFEIKQGVKNRFKKDEFGKRGLLVRESKTFVDLQKINFLQLTSQGIPPSNIEISPLCTACKTNIFYSHRIEGLNRGAMGAVIGLKGT